MTAAPNDALQRPRKRDRRADDEQFHGQVRRPEADGAELPAPEGFFDRFNVYKQAKFAIVRRIGITARVMPTWSPPANWSGITPYGDNVLLVNLPLLKTQGQFEETILHEMAHDQCGANCGHNQTWYSKLGQLNAALTDAKYAEEK